MQTRLRVVLPIALMVLLWSHDALALLTPAPDPLAFGPVRVGTTATGTVVITHSMAGSDTLDMLEKDAADTDCNRFTLTPSPALPQTLSGSQSVDVDVDFTPTARVAYSCTVTMRDGGGGSLGSFVLSGTGTDPEINVTPTALSFGGVAVTGGSAMLTFDIQNTGTADLVVGGITLGGANPGDFTITSAPTAPIPPAGSDTVTVTFNPAAEGARSATATVTSDDANEMMVVVDLDGTGQVKRIATSPDPLAIGSVVAGTSASGNITVTNSGQIPLALQSASITGGAGWITFTGNPQASCDGMTACDYTPDINIGAALFRTVGIRCAPPVGASGPQSATVAFTSNSDGAGSDNTVTVTCTATKPDISVSPLFFDFMDVAVAGGTGTGMITVMNVGTAALTYDITITGTNPADFSYGGIQCTAGAPCTLGVGAMRVFNVTFNPAADGGRSAFMNFNSNDQDPGDDPITVDLVGNGTGAEITRTSTAPMNFGQVDVGTTSPPLPLTFRNDGNVDLTISNITLPVSGVYAFAAGTTFPAVLTPGQVRTFNITCTPTDRQTYAGNATAANNSWNNTSLATALSCQGVAPDLRINNADIASHDFGGQPEGTVIMQTFTLSNPGEQTATNISFSLSSTTAGYSVMGLPSSLAPGATDSFTVTFSPTATEQGGMVTLTVNADPQALPVGVEDAQLNLNGDSLSNGINVSTPSLMFGDVRWDLTATQTFDITNEGESTFTVNSMMFSNTVDFELVQIRVDPQGDGTFQPPITTFSPFVLCGSADATAQCAGTSGGRAEVTVRFRPNDVTLGNLTGMITITCTLTSDNMRVVMLSGTSTSPMLAVEPGMTLDFGQVDVDIGPVTLPLRLRNTTTTSATMTVQSRTGPGAGPFSASAFVAGPVAPGASHDTDVTYDPTVETSGPETAMLVFDIVGLYPTVGPTSVMITLSGSGADRHIVTPGPVTFPPTYRYPDVPPEMDVVVGNSGAAPLNLTMSVLDGDPAFSIVSGGPTTVAGGGNAVFRVRFNPTMVGTFDSTLQVTHNDNGVAPIANIAVSGMGVSREMTMSGEFQIGVAAVGVPLRKDDLIQLMNTSAASTFRVRELRVVDTSGQLVVDPPADRMVPAGQLAVFGGELTATAPGPFATDVLIFLDGDPEPHGTVTLRGHAVEMEVSGSGCAASNGGGAGALALVLAVALGLARRRAAASTVAVVAVVVGASAARADIAVQSFHPQPSIEDDLFTVESATVGEPNAWTAGFGVTYALDPLVGTVIDCGGPCPPDVMEGDTDSLVRSQTAFLVGGAYAFAGRFEAGLTVPILRQSGESSIVGAAGAEGTTLGDVAVHAKAQLVKRGTFALGAGAVITAPTAKDGEYAGFSGPSGQVQLLASHRARRVLLSANAGFLGREAEMFGETGQGNALTFGAGGGFRVSPNLWLAAEVFGDVSLVENGRPSLQAIGGLRYRLGEVVSVGFGGGGGILDGLGVPRARGFLLVAYSPAMRPEPPLRAPPPPPDLRDSDGDGIRNAEDKCIEAAEDVDMFEDGDGCPDPDNDGDGIRDETDECDDKPEDKDGFKDADGCPEDDNDGDGISDKKDTCPNEPEDKDGHADLDGCIDLDNDHDGIPDTTDRCVAQPETINGNNDNDGCPDRGDSAVLLAADRIELLEPIRFTGTGIKLARKSDNVLAQIGATLRANPEIIRVRITVHVHPRWSRERDQTLSDQRAQVVRDWLLQWGIKPERLDARGFGSQKPLVAGKPKADEINDRIEFVIMERD